MNYDSITLEVEPIDRLGWLEEKLEIKSDGDYDLISLIAFDKNGRKFSNCTSTAVSFSMRDQNVIELMENQRNWEEIKEYLDQN
jgi:hypothetical protein